MTDFLKGLGVSVAIGLGVMVLAFAFLGLVGLLMLGFNYFLEVTGA